RELLGALNCAALPEQLLESELFGYERGAFTGAHPTTRWEVDLATESVLCLDEVSQMTLAAQSQVYASPAGTRVSAPRRHAYVEGGHPRHCGYESGPRPAS